MSKKQTLSLKDFQLNNDGMFIMGHQLCEIARRGDFGEIKVKPQVNSIQISFTPRGRLRSAIIDPSKLESEDSVPVEEQVILTFYQRPGQKEWDVVAAEEITRNLVYGNTLERNFAEMKVSDLMMRHLNDHLASKAKP